MVGFKGNCFFQLFSGGGGGAGFIWRIAVWLLLKGHRCLGVGTSLFWVGLFFWGTAFWLILRDIIVLGQFFWGVETLFVLGRVLFLESRILVGFKGRSLFWGWLFYQRTAFWLVLKRHFCFGTGSFIGEPLLGWFLREIFVLGLVLLLEKRFWLVLEGIIGWLDLSVAVKKKKSGDWDVHWRYGILTHGHVFFQKGQCGCWILGDWPRWWTRVTARRPPWDAVWGQIDTDGGLVGGGLAAARRNPAPPKKSWNDSIPLLIPASNGFPWFQDFVHPQYEAMARIVVGHLVDFGGCLTWGVAQNMCYLPLPAVEGIDFTGNVYS